MRKLAFCICKNKCTDQLCGKFATVQHLCFLLIDNAILVQSQILIHLILLYIQVCVALVRKPRRQVFSWCSSYEPRRENSGLRGFRPGPTQIRLPSLRKWLEAWNFVFRKERYCTIQVAKTKALISFAVTAKLICVFVFACAKNPVFSRRGSYKPCLTIR